MKKIYKKLTAVLVAFVLCLGINVYSPKADAYVSVSATSSVSIGGGVSVSVSISGDNISAYTLWVTYDSGVLQYNSGSGATINGGGGTVVISGTSAGTASLSFTAIANGTSGIYASGEVLNIEGEVINTSYGSSSVTVSTPSSNSGSGNNNSGGGNSGNSNHETDDRSSNCYLSSLEISEGELEPEFDPETYEYTLRLADGTKNVVINAIPDDDKASTSITGNEEFKQGENTVEIIVTAENGAVKKYTINAIVGEILEDVVINIGGMDYNIVNSSEDITPPENFSSTTIKYDKWDVMAYNSPNGKITVMCLSNRQNTNKWFIYNAADGEFYEYKEYSSKYNRYIILPFPQDVVYPDNYVMTETVIFGDTVQAYQDIETFGKEKYIIYGMNLDGDEGFFIFDMNERVFMSYDMPVVATSGDAQATPLSPEPADKFSFLPDFLTRDIMFFVICGAGALLLIFIICLIAFGCKIGKLNKELDELEEENEKLILWEKKKVKEEPAAAKIEDADMEETATEEQITEEAATEEQVTEEQATEEKADDETSVENETEHAETEIEPVSEIPVVDIGMPETENQKEEYDPEKDSAF